MTEARDLRELVADRVRRRRHQMRLTQEELAREAWRLGRPSVTRSVIAAVERGTADLTLTELAGLLRALDMNLEELLGSGGKVFLDQGVSIDVDDVVDQVLGRATSWDYTTDSTARIVKGRHGIVAGYVQSPISPVEVKAGQKLGVPPEEVRRAAGARWERSLDEERDARLKAKAPEGASERTIQALRGHITRTLLKELEPALHREQTTKPRSRGKH